MFVDRSAFRTVKVERTHAEAFDFLCCTNCMENLQSIANCFNEECAVLGAEVSGRRRVLSR